MAQLRRIRLEEGDWDGRSEEPRGNLLPKLVIAISIFHKRFPKSSIPNTNGGRTSQDQQRMDPTEAFLSPPNGQPSCFDKRVDSFIWLGF